MNFLKISVFVLSLLFAVPASADLASIFNPFAWIRAAQRSYNWARYPEKMSKAKQELERLHQIRLETDTLNKIYWAIGKAISHEKFATDKEFVEILRRDVKKLYAVFISKQKEWALANYVYEASSIKNFNEYLLEPAIKKAEQKNYVSSSSLAESWYEKLKKAEQNLSKKERNKTAGQRQQELTSWQKRERRTKLPLSKESEELFEALQRKKKNS